MRVHSTAQLTSKSLIYWAVVFNSEVNLSSFCFCQDRASDCPSMLLRRAAASVEWAGELVFHLKLKSGSQVGWTSTRNSGMARMGGSACNATFNKTVFWFKQKLPF
jgi:hypothetical protein